MRPAPFTIADVADLLSIQRLKGGDENAFNVECPFCGDMRGKCNFSVIKNGEVSNVFQCFNCGAQGNMLTLYADLMGIWGIDRYKEAYHQIKASMQFGQQECRQRQNQLDERAQQQKEKSVESMDYHKRDQVYRAMLKQLHLSELHRNDLRRRGQTESEIQKMEERGYVSTDPKNSTAIARRLIKQGYDLEGVPGFFVNNSGDWEIAFYRKNNGYLCPVWSEEGLLTAFQIRLDPPNSKYIWLASTKFQRGCSSGCPVSLSGNPYAKRVYVTEGILKADITHLRSGKTYLGNPGVGNSKDLKRMLQVLTKNGLEEVIEAFDMDKAMRLDCSRDYGDICSICELRNRDIVECPKKRIKRDNIRKGCLKLYQIWEEIGLTCRRALWDCDDEGMWLGNYKGCDDWEMKEDVLKLSEQAA